MRSFVCICFIGLSIFLLGCGPSGDDGYGPCWGGGSFYQTDEITDTIALSDTFPKWLNLDSLSDNLFINNNGFEAAFGYSGVSGQSETYGPTGYYSYTGGECNNSHYVYEHVLLRQRHYTFTGKNISLRFSYIRSASYQKDSALAAARPDCLKIDLNNTIFMLPFNDSTAKNWALLDSIRLGGTLYKNVYHVYLDSSKMNLEIVGPAGVYYAIEKGLVGFYLNNGELWGKP